MNDAAPAIQGHLKATRMLQSHPSRQTQNKKIAVAHCYVATCSPARETRVQIPYHEYFFYLILHISTKHLSFLTGQSRLRPRQIGSPQNKIQYFLPTTFE